MNATIEVVIKLYSITECCMMEVLLLIKKSEENFCCSNRSEFIVGVVCGVWVAEPVCREELMSTKFKKAIQDLLDVICKEVIFLYLTLSVDPINEKNHKKKVAQILPSHRRTSLSAKSVHCSSAVTHTVILSALCYNKPSKLKCRMPAFWMTCTM